MTSLFDPYTLKGVTLRNRIGVPPMCQYSAVDGLANDWHLVHVASMARGGAGLLVMEATAVSPEGRITPACLGLWNDAQRDALKPMVAAIKAGGAVPGIQIAHAGRKASANVPWEGDDHIAEGDPRGWQTIAPSAIAYGDGLPKVPHEMSIAEIHRVRDDFVAAAHRALRCTGIRRPRRRNPGRVHRAGQGVQVRRPGPAERQHRLHHQGNGYSVGCRLPVAYHQARAR